jgi:UDP-N-acetylglucosamine diphosphorylase/glucosamine-1-phosphate N-acetyltransferase
MVALFEDAEARWFYPVGLTRHVSELLVGTMTLRQRVERVTGESAALIGRPHIRRHLESRGLHIEPSREPLLLLNARLFVDRDLLDRLPRGEEWIATSGSTIVAARFSPESQRAIDWTVDPFMVPEIQGVPHVELEGATLYAALWEMIADNGARIREDFVETIPAVLGDVSERATLIEPIAIAVAVGARVRPGAVLDASDGPIVIDTGVEVMPLSLIQGPCYIGAGSKIKAGARIYGMTSIGPACKVGGEVENSIILGYSNKQHEGFLGHSYVGQWVNIGADTNTSDLKNNYGSIRVMLDGREFDTGRMFLGTLMGDHVKTGINTMLNTGTVIGVAANVFGGGFPPKEIPSFAWGGSDGFDRFRIDRAIELARTVTARRGVEFTEGDAELLRWLASSQSGVHANT